MHPKALKLYYGLAIFVLMNALFVMSGGVPERPVAEFKHQIKQEFAKAFIQTIGDKPWFTGLEIAVSGITDFYQEAADEMIALLDPNGSDEDLWKVAREIGRIVYRPDVSNAPDRLGLVAGLLLEGDYMIGEPLYNIHPDFNVKPEQKKLSDEELSDLFLKVIGIRDQESRIINGGEVAGVDLNSYFLIPNSKPEPANRSNEWLTVQDNYTGQLYCLAVYNGEVNKYLGACIKDGYQ